MKNMQLIILIAGFARIRYILFHDLLNLKGSSKTNSSKKYTPSIKGERLF